MKQGFIEIIAVLICISLYLIQGSKTDTALRNIDNTLQSDAVSTVIDSFQVSKDILDLAALIEVDATDEFIWYATQYHLFFQCTRLCVGAVENGNIGITGCGCGKFQNIFCSSMRFFQVGLIVIVSNRCALFVVCPKRLILTFIVVTDDFIGSFQNRLGGTIILL